MNVWLNFKTMYKQFLICSGIWVGIFQWTGQKIHSFITIVIRIYLQWCNNIFWKSVTLKVYYLRLPLQSNINLYVYLYMPIACYLYVNSIFHDNGRLAKTEMNKNSLYFLLFCLWTDQFWGLILSNWYIVSLVYLYVNRIFHDNWRLAKKEMNTKSLFFLLFWLQTDQFWGLILSNGHIVSLGYLNILIVVKNTHE